jgi:hypothetical protein
MQGRIGHVQEGQRTIGQGRQCLPAGFGVERQGLRDEAHGHQGSPQRAGAPFRWQA